MLELLLWAALSPAVPLCAQAPRFVAGELGPAPAPGLVFRGDQRQLDVLTGGRRLARLRQLPGGLSIQGQDRRAGLQVLRTARGWRVRSAYGPLGHIEGRRASFGGLDWVLQDDQAWSAQGPGPRVHNPNPERPAGGAEALFLLIPGLSSAEAEGLLRYIACTGALPLGRPAPTADQTFLLAPFIGDGFWIGSRPDGLRYGTDPAHPEGRLRLGADGVRVLSEAGTLRAQTRPLQTGSPRAEAGRCPPPGPPGLRPKRRAGRRPRPGPTGAVCASSGAPPTGGFVVQDDAGRTLLRVRQRAHRFELSRPGGAVFAVIQGDRADLGGRRALVRDHRLFQRRELAQLRAPPELPADELALLYHASGLGRAAQAALLGELAFRQRRRRPADRTPLRYQGFDPAKIAGGGAPGRQGATAAQPSPPRRSSAAPQLHLELIPLAGDRYRLQRRHPGSASDPRPADLDAERFVWVQPGQLQLQTATGQRLAQISLQPGRWTLRDRRGRVLIRLQATDGGWRLLDPRGRPLGRLDGHGLRTQNRKLSCGHQSAKAQPAHARPKPASAPSPAGLPPSAAPSALPPACLALLGAVPDLGEDALQLLIAAGLLHPELP